MLLLFCAGAWRAAALLFAGACVTPSPFLSYLERRRLERLDEQVVPFLEALLRSLGAVPALGEALLEARQLVDPPLADELVETCDEVQLGLTLEQALVRLEERVPSRNLKVALLTLRVGQKTGGNLEVVLGATLDALRELGRLESVLRSKTAEGKLQVRVIGVIPIPLIAAVRAVDPSFFLPLETTFLGHLVVLFALGLWGSSFLLASRILKIDL